MAIVCKLCKDVLGFLASSYVQVFHSNKYTVDRGSTLLKYMLEIDTRLLAFMFVL